MPDCDPTTCRYITDLRHALEVTEAALARSQDRCDKLRSQLVRLQHRAGMSSQVTSAETAAMLGIAEQSLRVLRYRNPDFPQPVNEKTPRLWERTDIEEWLTRHPRAGRKR